jgi:hypothetical protein
MFSHRHKDDHEFTWVIESAEVPGPVFTEKISYEAIQRTARSDEFRRLRDLADELARNARPA